MSWIVSIAAILQILLLLYVATMDVATRIISNEICLALAILGIAGHLTNPAGIAGSLLIATVLFMVLFIVYRHGSIGGGDVKLLVALALGLPWMGVVQLLTITALAGGVLALVHVMMRSLPHPSVAPAGSSLPRRVYAVERWRHLRRAPLPYGVAIACGGIGAILNRGF
ncbi:MULTISPECIES: A24 family peptidase [Bradyrhizobium]|uniref:A24 family peptidase n=1 Tax=Bradyrhizobium TaxID=374 RepID=UPI001BA5B7BC|nr:MULTISPECIES: A24 family peptidase [Bradyrhizobium]MBR0712161.1 prepilin peptidase [Bradyrhizobium liaoningense]MDA9397733.1 pilus assembly protein CpaA [Bradyrhizobium sp. CCBAU 45389]